MRAIITTIHLLLQSSVVPRGDRHVIDEAMTDGQRAVAILGRPAGRPPLDMSFYSTAFRELRPSAVPKGDRHMGWVK